MRRLPMLLYVALRAALDVKAAIDGDRWHTRLTCKLLALHAYLFGAVPDFEDTSPEFRLSLLRLNAIALRARRHT